MRLPLASLALSVALLGCSASTDAGSNTPPPPPPSSAPPPATAQPSATPPPPPPPPPSASAAPAERLRYTVEKGQVKLPGPIEFDLNKDTIKPESDKYLALVKEYLDDKPEITKLRIEGHTDNQGDEKLNQKLSELRSLAVARWLVAKGIKCERLVAVGFGKGKPVADNGTPEGRAQNRRTAFINAELKGKSIGGMPLDGGGVVAGNPCK